MFVNVSYTHAIILIAYVVITVAALLSVWARPAKDTVAQRIIWTIVIVGLPGIGGIMWFIWWAVASRLRTTPSNAS